MSTVFLNKTLPKSSLQKYCISVRFYEMDVTFSNKGINIAFRNFLENIFTVKNFSSLSLLLRDPEAEAKLIDLVYFNYLGLFGSSDVFRLTYGVQNFFTE